MPDFTLVCSESGCEWAIDFWGPSEPEHAILPDGWVREAPDRIYCPEHVPEIVLVATDDDCRKAVVNGLRRAGCTFDELAEMHRNNDFLTDRQYLVWCAIGDLGYLAPLHVDFNDIDDDGLLGALLTPGLAVPEVGACLQLFDADGNTCEGEVVSCAPSGLVSLRLDWDTWWPVDG